MSTIEIWNRRAAYLLRVLEDPPSEDHSSPLARARATMGRWRTLLDVVPHRALSAAVHQGLNDGLVKRAVERLSRGCLVLAGTAGGGKTTGAAWLAHEGYGSVLWLDAVAVGQAHPDRIGEWRQAIQTAGLVVLDDLGAGSSVGDWSSRKVADVLSAILDRTKPSIVATNLDRERFASSHDGRIVSRANMTPNVWIDVMAKDRRTDACVPPDLVDADGEPANLPPREADAMALLTGRRVLTEVSQAFVLADVDHPGMTTIAKALGFSRWSDVDRAASDHERRMVEAQTLVVRTTERLRLLVAEKPANDPPDDPAASNRQRLALLDIVAYLAAEQGVDEGVILERIGRTRRTLGPADEPSLRAMVAETV